jgi:hypothetical protein
MVPRSGVIGRARVFGVTTDPVVTPSFPGTQEVGAWSR